MKRLSPGFSYTIMKESYESSGNTPKTFFTSLNSGLVLPNSLLVTTMLAPHLFTEVFTFQKSLERQTKSLMSAVETAFFPRGFELLCVNMSMRSTSSQRR